MIMNHISIFFFFSLISSFLYAQVEGVSVKLTDENSFSIVVLPDLQSYNKFAANQPALELMTAWIARKTDDLKVKTVLCTGDLVDQNGILAPNGKSSDQTGEQQWQSVSRALARLDNRVDYVCCTGNHDYGYISAENRHSRFPEFFSPERNPLWEKSLVATTVNAWGVHTLENAAYEYETDTWGKLLVVSLEFAPRQEVIDWAKGLITSDTYKNHKVILLTHSYLHSNGKIIEKEGYGVDPANYGQHIWNELINPSDNIVMVVCGHACNLKGYEENVAFTVGVNEKGREIPQMMWNAQTADQSWVGNGGDGWLRILEFMPDGQTVSVRTFSPLFGFSKITADKAWRTESYDQFTFTIK